MNKKVILHLVLLMMISATAGSCSRKTSPAYHGTNRVSTRPHKEWKKPRSRYVKPKKRYKSTFHYIDFDPAGVLFFNCPLTVCVELFA